MDGAVSGTVASLSMVASGRDFVVTPEVEFRGVTLYHVKCDASPAVTDLGCG